MRLSPGLSSFDYFSLSQYARYRVCLVGSSNLYTPLLLKMLVWLSRCLPGFSIIALTAILVCAFSGFLSSAAWLRIFPPSLFPPFKDPWNGLNIAQIVFVIYNVFVHVQMCAFTLRLGWSFTNMIKQTRLAIQRRTLEDPVAPTGHRVPFDNSEISIAKYVSEHEEGAQIPELIHAIVLPNYCEDLHTLETTLKVLASHPRARSQYEVGFSWLFVDYLMFISARSISQWS